MKFIHLSDLHIGKRVKDFSMIEDQRYILAQILELIDGSGAEAVLIAGDVYDKPVPSAEAVELFDDFLVSLHQRGLKVFVISGNHDSPERIAFGAKLFDKSGVYLSPVYDGKVEPVRLEDEYGGVNVYMLPFIRAAQVRRCFPDEEINSLSDALALAVKKLEINRAERNVLMLHQFVGGAESCESELSVGTMDAVSGDIFEGIDYVALGHIHGAQNVAGPYVRYCGSPLKYSFSEAGHKKSLSLVELCEKGDVRVSVLPLSPLRDMAVLRGNYEELLSRPFYEACPLREAYLHIILSDEEELPNALACLRLIYPNIMKLEYDNARSRETRLLEVLSDSAGKTPLEIFAEHYEQQNNRPMSEVQLEYITKLIGELEGEVS